MEYSPGIQFQTSLINMEEAKELTMSNQPEKKQQNWCWCGSIKHLRVSSKDCPVGLAIIKATKMALGMGLSQSEAKKAAEDATVEEESKFLAAEAAEEGEKSAAEVTEDGYFLLGLVLMGGSLQMKRWLDCTRLIVSYGSTGLYWLDCIIWIVSVLVLGLLGETGFYALSGLLLAGWDIWTGWDVGGTGLGWRDRR